MLDGNPAAELQCLAHSTHLTCLRDLMILAAVLDAAAGAGLAAVLTSPHIASSLRALLLTSGSVDEQVTTPLAAALSSANNGSNGLAALQHMGLYRVESMHVAREVLCAVLSNHQLTSLRVLTFHGSTLDAGSMQHAMGLLPAAQHLSGLEQLDLSNTGFADGGATALAVALRTSTQLRALHTLKLAGNKISHAGAAQLRDALTSSPHLAALRELDVQGNYREARELLAEACRTTPHLQQVEVPK
jgi:hypothetical protein